MRPASPWHRPLGIRSAVHIATRRRWTARTLLILLALALGAAGLHAQQTERRPRPTTAAPRVDLADGPQVFEADGQHFRVVPITGLERPWALAVLPNLDILVTEREGRLRVIRDRGAGCGASGRFTRDQYRRGETRGLMDVILHPQFEENQLIYFTYSKAMPGSPFTDFPRGPGSEGEMIERDAATATLARARYDGGDALKDVTDVFVSDAWSQGTSGARIAFSRDGKIIMAIGMPTRHMIGTADDAQNPGQPRRQGCCGSTRTARRRTTIRSSGARATGPRYTPWGSATRSACSSTRTPARSGRPRTAPWVVTSSTSSRRAGTTAGRSCRTAWTTTTASWADCPAPPPKHPWAPGMEEPFAFWMPSPALAGIIFYTGDKFPTWKGNAFIAALGRGNLGSRQLHRVVFNDQGLIQRNGRRTLMAGTEAAHSHHSSGPRRPPVSGDRRAQRARCCGSSR